MIGDFPLKILNGFHAVRPSRSDHHLLLTPDCHFEYSLMIIHCNSNDSNIYLIVGNKFISSYAFIPDDNATPLANYANQLPFSTHVKL